ncbi:MAG: 3-dehydroquinate synthase [Balneolaceae bacterium]|nr:MAG: 3-dehydroquinate synthase [Balneolaceae bacterium]
MLKISSRKSNKLVHHFNIDTSGTHTCQVYAGHGSLSVLPERIRLYNQKKVLLLIDENVDELYGQRITEMLVSEGFVPAVHKIPPGETSKSAGKWLEAVDFCFDNGVNRKTPLVAIGGGVTGDLAGYVAASVMRGIPLVQVPTTLLAMVDSSLGGKTGINHPSGKNLIGAFYQPDTIISDIVFLETLPAREWRCGMAEIIKYGAIADPELFALAARFKSGYSEPAKLTELIIRCAGIKAAIVTEDEKEAGKRAWLNFGHTFAHALESLTDYRRFSHGEAVYIGMVAALKLSNLAGASLDESPLFQFLDGYKLKVLDLKPRIPDLVAKMFLDKKSLNNTVRVVLLNSYGQPRIDDITDLSLLEKSWDFALETCN